MISKIQSAKERNQQALVCWYEKQKTLKEDPVRIAKKLERRTEIYKRASEKRKTLTLNEDPVIAAKYLERKRENNKHFREKRKAKREKEVRETVERASNQQIDELCAFDELCAWISEGISLKKIQLKHHANLTSLYH
jgi:hypothetical protein